MNDLLEQTQANNKVADKINNIGLTTLAIGIFLANTIEGETATQACFDYVAHHTNTQIQSFANTSVTSSYFGITPRKRSVRARYEKMAQTDRFKKAYENRSLGEIVELDS